MRIKDRPELTTKPKPLTFKEDQLVSDAVAKMSEMNYGSVVIVGEDNRIAGIVTERDILKRLVNEGRDARTTPLSDIMTREVKVAHVEDDLVDWMRVMSTDRFRRLPVVDDDNHPIAILTQTDLIAYSWPELMSQAAQIASLTVRRNYNLFIILGGILLYTLFLVFILRAL
ncbi:MAG: CBS domain-containing protein [Rhodomicrobium sp.]|nr:CBS domain-containing protein [Rhodomicrobium sp.]